MYPFLFKIALHGASSIIANSRFLAQELQNTFNLSSENTFLTGMSNGAEISYLVACESPGTFKAYAPVAGTIFTDGLPNNSTRFVGTPVLY